MVKRVYKASRKPRGRTSGFKKAVSAIAKKAVLRISETKTGVFSNNLTYGSSGTLFGAVGGGLATSIGQGVQQNQRVGDQIRFIGLKIRGFQGIDPTVVTAQQGLCGMRVLVVAGKRPLTSADMPVFKGACDPEILTVISDRYHKLTSNNFGVFMNQYIKFHRNINYVGSAAVKNELYLWLIPAPYGTGLTTTTGYAANLDVQMYWKDL